MSAFATKEDYIKRYDTTVEDDRLNILLEDASNFLSALYFEEWGEEYKQGEHALFDANACAVTCAVVSRAINVPAGMEGVSQASQGADSYSASFTFANPTGDFYITKSDRQRLGMVGGGIFTIEPMINRDHEEQEEKEREKNELLQN